jgi:hypothetical protein
MTLCWLQLARKAVQQTNIHLQEKENNVGPDNIGKLEGRIGRKTLRDGCQKDVSEHRNAVSEFHSFEPLYNEGRN